MAPRCALLMRAAADTAAPLTPRLRLRRRAEIPAESFRSVTPLFSNRPFQRLFPFHQGKGLGFSWPLHRAFPDQRRASASRTSIQALIRSSASSGSRRPSFTAARISRIAVSRFSFSVAPGLFGGGREGDSALDDAVDEVFALRSSCERLCMSRAAVRIV